MSIMLGETEVQKGGNATWAEGENVLTITVTAGEEETEYTVTVTKSEAAQDEPQEVS